MSFSRTLLLCGAFLLGVACTAHASSGGSTYSVLGLGDLRYMPGARSAGMGYTGIGLFSSQYINPTAPATWSRITRVRLDASVLYEGYNSSDGHVSRYLSGSNFAGAVMAIPISPLDGIVFVTGFTPYSNVDFDLATSGSYQADSGPINYTLRHVGTGGLGQAQIGLSWAPRDQWSLGASLSYVFGTINKVTTMTAKPNTIATSISTETNDIHGVVGNLGLIYSGFGGALSPMALGFSMSTPGIFASARQVAYTFSGGGQGSTAYDTLSLIGGNITVPIALGFGISWTLSDRLAFAADYRTQAWGSSKFYGEPPVGIRNNQMAGVGFERSASRDPASTFLDHLAFRLGFVYNATYYQVKGIPINEWTGTGGLSLPISGDARLNLSGEWGVRGKQSSALVRETIFRFTASLTLGEMWFVRPDED